VAKPEDAGPPIPPADQAEAKQAGAEESYRSGFWNGIGAVGRREGCESTAGVRPRKLAVASTIAAAFHRVDVDRMVADAKRK
jgi:hypothetical protein